MKFPIALAISALALSSARADQLTDADREALLENLEKLRSDAYSRQDGKFRVALAAYRAAMVDDAQAMELYLKCIEKVNYSDNDRKSQDFREWKRKEAEQLADPALRSALRYQLSWLVLTLQAAADEPNLPKLRAEAESLIESIFRNAQSLASQEQLLSQSVIASVFARAYDIKQVKIENWPLAPAQLAEIYEQLIFPAHRSPDRIATLRTAWIKRIMQETARREFWGGKKGPSAPEFERYLAEILPQMQWNMEKDLFTYGDQSGAAVRMLAHIEKYIAHPRAREWGEEFKALLTPTAPATAPATAEAAP
jgi:hypothetical protein